MVSTHEINELARKVTNAGSEPSDRSEAFSRIAEIGVDEFLADARTAGGDAAAFAVTLQTAIGLVQHAEMTATEFGLPATRIAKIGERIDILLGDGRAFDAAKLAFAWLSVAFATYAEVADKADTSGAREEATNIARRIAAQLETLVDAYGEEIGDGEPAGLLDEPL